MIAVIDTHEDKEPKAVVRLDVVRRGDTETDRIHANRDIAAFIPAMLEVFGEEIPGLPVRIIAQDVPAADHPCRPYNKNEPHNSSKTCSNDKSRCVRTTSGPANRRCRSKRNRDSEPYCRQEDL